MREFLSDRPCGLTVDIPGSELHDSTPAFIVGSCYDAGLRQSKYMGIPAAIIASPVKDGPGAVTKAFTTNHTETSMNTPKV
jgi:hypothetical protein